jgi:glycosyltransferase involved in cell wall biosynthesis
MSSPLACIVTARNEADRLPATLASLASAFPGARIIVADDGSEDATGEVAAAAGADVVPTGTRLGKGGAATRAGERLRGSDAVVLLCDGDLGAGAGRLAELVERVRAGEADVAVAVFAHRVGGGVGAARGFARWAIRRLVGLELDAPLSGQRALAPRVIDRILPFADGFGMEVGMTVDAARAGLRVREYPLDLEHRATGRTPAGFAHRARQLADIARACRARRSSPGG